MKTRKTSIWSLFANFKTNKNFSGKSVSVTLLVSKVGYRRADRWTDAQIPGIHRTSPSRVPKIYKAISCHWFFSIPLENIKNQSFLDTSKGYMKKLVVSNGLIKQENSILNKSITSTWLSITSKCLHIFSSIREVSFEILLQFNN